MGFFKSVSKVVKKTTDSVSKPLVSSLKRLSKGDLKGGIGDLTSGATRIGLDIATGGNKKLVDGFSGGLLSSAEGARRGNLKDIVRTGVTATAAYFGGPMTAMAINQKFASGQKVQNIALDYAKENSGMDMSFLNQANDFLSNPVVSSYLTNRSPKRPPKVPVPVISVDNPMEDQNDKGISSKMLLYFGGGAVVLFLIVFLIIRRKK